MNAPLLPPNPPATQTVRAELVGPDTCSAFGITATAHAPVLRLCQLLIEAGIDPQARLEAFRAGVLSLTVRTLAEGATLEVRPGRNTGTPVFVHTGRGSARAAPSTAARPAAAIGTPPAARRAPDRRARHVRPYPREHRTRQATARFVVRVQTSGSSR
jgi:hypothetical protein